MKLPRHPTTVLRTLCAMILFVLPALAAFAEPVTVAWDPNPAEEQVTGYYLYYGETSAGDPAFTGYDAEMDVGNVTEYEVALPDASVVYYLAVVAYNGAGLRSDYSTEVTRDVAAPTTYTVAVSGGAGGSVSPSGNVSVNHGGSLTVSITPNTGYAVADVQVDGASVGAVSSYTLSNVTAAHTVSASFVVNTYTVAVSGGAGGSVSPSGNVSVNHGGSLTVSITPNTGYAVADVQVDGSSVGAVSSYTLSNVTAAHTVSASFVVNTYTVAVSSGAGGSVSPSGNVSVNHGGSLTVSITPNTGYAVADVQVDGASVGAVSSYTLSNVTAAHTVSASFVVNTYTVAVSSGAGGSVSPSGNVSVNHGGSLTVSITPNTGYAVADVQVDGASVGAVSSYTLSNVTAAHTVSASFVVNTYTVVASAGPNGSVTPSGTVTVEHGSSLAFTISPDAGFQVADVLVDGSSAGPVETYTFAAIDSGHTISATFEAAEELTTVTAVAAGATWSYFKGVAGPGANWTAADFDASSWATGATGIGYGDGDDATVLGDMQGSYVTVFTRRSFAITDTAAVRDMVLHVDYDDGFVAFLNGTEVARSGVVGTPAFDTPAEAAHEAGSAEVFSLGAHMGLLRDGGNTLAISIHNTDVGSSDLSLIPRLDVTYAGGEPAPTTYTVALSAGSGGGVGPNGDVSVIHGDSLTVSITPDAGYSVADVLVDGSSVGAVSSYTLSNITAAHTVSASFTADPTSPTQPNGLRIVSVTTAGL